MAHVLYLGQKYDLVDPKDFKGREVTDPGGIEQHFGCGLSELKEVQATMAMIWVSVRRSLKKFSWDALGNFTLAEISDMLVYTDDELAKMKAEAETAAAEPIPTVADPTEP